MNTIFVEKLNYLITTSGKTQNAICKDIGIPRQQLSKWKTGYIEPNLDNLMLLAKYFDVSTDYLLGLEDENGRKIYNTNNTYNNYGTHKGDVNF